MLDGALLVLAWLFPLLLGLALLARPRFPLVPASLAAVPALMAAWSVPAGTVVEAPAMLLGAQFSLDDTGQAFLLFTALLWLCAGLYAFSYLRQDARRPLYFAFFLLAMAGNLSLIVAGDMLTFYLGYALMSFASYGLVVHTGQDEARYAGRIYIILVVIGEVLLFAALAMIAVSTGTLSLDSLTRQPIGGLAAALVFVSFGIKAGVAMLHMWLPLAHPAAPIPASAVLSGAMIKAGVLGWLRFLSPAGAALEYGGVLVGAGLATAFFGAAIGVSQVNPKTVLAYSSISQIGLITVSVGAWLITGDTSQAALVAVLLYVMHHGMAKGALFLGVGFAGAGRRVLAVLLLPALALAGLPLTSGAAAKAVLKTTTATLPGQWPALLDVLLPLAAVGTTLLMARFLWLIHLSPRQAKRLPRLMWAAWLALIVCVALFMLAWPAAAQAIPDALKPDKLWVATWPIIAGALLAAAAARFLKGLALPLFPPGDVLVVFESVYRRLHGGWGVLAHAFRRREARIRAGWAAWRGLVSIGPTFARWELRLRADWIVAGSSLLILALAMLLVIGLAR